MKAWQGVAIGVGVAVVVGGAVYFINGRVPAMVTSPSPPAYTPTSSGNGAGYGMPAQQSGGSDFITTVQSTLNGASNAANAFGGLLNSITGLLPH